MTNVTRVCSIDGCDRKHQSRGFCHKHYIAKRYEICDRATMERRFWAKVDRTGGPDACWLWTASVDQKGYGSFESRRAHRVAYEFVVGPIPVGLQIDHLCRIRNCVNPKHLEPVTNAENARRAAAAVSHCRHGHELTPENVYLWNNARICRTCRREKSLRWWRANRSNSAEVA